MTELSDYSTTIPEHQRDVDREYYDGLAAAFDTGPGTILDRLKTFTKYVPTGDIGRFVLKDRIFQKILGVHGHIVECGVFLGGGVMTWAQLSALYEPLNHARRIVGFDTFSGFPEVHAKDSTEIPNPRSHPGGFAAPAYDELLEVIRLFDHARPIGHIPRVSLVKGDALVTMPQYVAESPHLVVALLYLDFDVYEPTKAAIETFLPRMPKGSVIAFDELNHASWPGETMAVLDSIGIRSLRLERFAFQSTISFAVLE
jgi:hypothetical protein